MTISSLAKLATLRPSAIRYYESIGLLDPPPRISGQRRYDSRAVRRLAVIRQAQDAGFTLAEIKSVVRSRGSLAQAWKAIAAEKLTEIDRQMAGLQQMRELIVTVQQACQCLTADECGARVLQNRRQTK